VSDIDPKLSQIYREAASEGPPAALDAAILAAARKHVAQPQRRERSAWLRWMAPASAIATLVLGVSIALLVEREQPEPTRDMSVHPIRSLPQSPPPAGETDSAKATAADSAAPEAAAKREAPAAAAPVIAPAATVPAQAPAAPTPPAPLAFPAESRAKAGAPGMAAPKAAESKMSAPTAAESKTMRESNAARDAAPGSAAAGASAAPAAAPPAPAAAGSIAPQRGQSAQRSPEAWLEDISRLKREGRDKEAAEQLAEFRKAYPAYALPERLLLK